VARVPVLNKMAGRLKRAFLIHDLKVSLSDLLITGNGGKRSKASTLAKLIVEALITIEISLTQSVKGISIELVF